MVKRARLDDPESTWVSRVDGVRPVLVSLERGDCGEFDRREHWNLEVTLDRLEKEYATGKALNPNAADGTKLFADGLAEDGVHARFEARTTAARLARCPPVAKSRTRVRANLNFAAVALQIFPFEALHRMRVGRNVIVDIGKAREAAAIEAIDVARAAITVRLERAHTGTYPIFLGNDHGFGCLEEVFAFLEDPVTLGLGESAGWDRGADGEIRFNVALDRDEDVRAKAAMMARGRIPRRAERDEPCGFLSQEFVQPRPTQNGSLGGTKNESRHDLYVDVERAVLESGVSDRDLALLRAAHYGEWSMVAKPQLARFELPRHADAVPTLVRRKPDELAKRINARWPKLEAIDAADVGRWIARAARDLSEELQLRGLMKPAAAQQRRRKT